MIAARGLAWEASIMSVIHRHRSTRLRWWRSRWIVGTSGARPGARAYTVIIIKADRVPRMEIAQILHRLPILVRVLTPIAIAQRVPLANRALTELRIVRVPTRSLPAGLAPVVATVQMALGRYPILYRGMETMGGIAHGYRVRGNVMMVYLGVGLLLVLQSLAGACYRRIGLFPLNYVSIVVAPQSTQAPDFITSMSRIVVHRGRMLIVPTQQTAARVYLVERL